MRQISSLWLLVALLTTASCSDSFLFESPNSEYSMVLTRSHVNYVLVLSVKMSHRGSYPVSLELLTKDKKKNCELYSHTQLCVLTQSIDANVKVKLYCLQENKCSGMVHVLESPTRLYLDNGEGIVQAYQPGLVILPPINRQSVLTLIVKQAYSSELMSSVFISSSFPVYQYLETFKQDLHQSGKVTLLFGIGSFKPSDDRFLIIDILNENVKKNLYVSWQPQPLEVQQKTQFLNFVNLKSSQDNVFTFKFNHQFTGPQKSVNCACFRIKILQPESRQNIHLQLNITDLPARKYQQMTNVTTEFKAMKQFEVYSSQICDETITQMPQFEIKFSVEYYGNKTEIMKDIFQEYDMAVFIVSWSINHKVLVSSNQFLHLKAAASQSLELIVIDSESQTKFNQQIPLLILTNPKEIAATPSECSQRNNCHVTLLPQVDCLHCSIQIGDKPVKNQNSTDIAYKEVTGNSYTAKIDNTQTQYISFVVPPKQTVQVRTNTPNIWIYLLEVDPDDQQSEETNEGQQKPIIIDLKTNPKSNNTKVIAENIQALTNQNSSANSQSDINEDEDDDDDEFQYCQNPSDDCYTQLVGSNRPTSITNQFNTNMTIQMAIFGLDKCQYVIHFDTFRETRELIEDEAYRYVLKEQDDYTVFFFKVPGFVQPYLHKITFTLIGPLKGLYLIVRLGKQQLGISHEGYIILEPPQITDPELLVQIGKNNAFKGLAVHYSLFASSRTRHFALDTGVVHYETFAPDQQRTYLIEYQKDVHCGLSISTEDRIGRNVNYRIQIRKIRFQQQTHIADQFLQLLIVEPTTMIDLNNSQFTKLCDENDCQFEFKIFNQLKETVDAAFLLFASESMIQIKDGVWQTLQLNQISYSTHFFFYPRRLQPLNIALSSDDMELSFDYRIQSTSYSSNPNDWNFKWVTHQKQDGPPVRHAAIQPSQQEYWLNCPECVLLVTITGKSTSSLTELLKTHKKVTFSIMIANNVFQLQQNQRLAVVLNQNSNKTLFIDTKHFIDKPSVTFFTTFAIGFADVYANIFADGEQSFPTIKQHDVAFDYSQTNIDLKALIAKKNLQKTVESGKSIYIVLLIVSQRLTKMSIDFNSKTVPVRQLSLQDISDAIIKPGTLIVYQFIPIRDYRIQFTRTKGMPKLLIKSVLSDELEETLQEISEAAKKFGQSSQISSEQLPDQQDDEQLYFEPIYSRSHLYEGTLAINSIVLLALTSDVSSQVSIHLLTSQTETEVKPNVPVTSSLQPSESQTFLLTATRDQDTFVFFEVGEGQVVVEVSDYLNFSKSIETSDQERVFQFTVPRAQSLTKLVNQEGSPVHNSLFQYVYVKVFNSGTDDASFTLAYSTQNKRLKLRDGSIEHYQLPDQSKLTLFYENDDSVQAYFSLTNRGSTEQLKALQVRMFCYISIDGNMEEREQIALQIPPISQNQNTSTIIYEIPEKYKLVEIQLSTLLQIEIMVCLSHMELVFLPLSTRMPFRLHPDEKVEIVVDSPNFQHLQVLIGKCTDSEPQILLATSLTEFKSSKSFIPYLSQGGDIFRQILTLENSTQLFIMLEAEQRKGSLLTVQVRPAKLGAEHEFRSSFKPGNHGLVQYQLIDSETAQISFEPVQCGNKCPQSTSYQLIASSSLDGLFQSSNCPNHHLLLSSSQEPAAPETVLITIGAATKLPTSHITFQYKMIRPISYLLVRASNNVLQHQVVYRAVEIVTLWGQMSRVSLSLIIVIIGLILAVLSAVVLATRAMARRGYRPVSESD